MHSTRPLKQLEERVRNRLKLVSNTILAIMRPGCLILTDTILRSSIKASRRQNIVHQGGETSCCSTALDLVPLSRPTQNANFLTSRSIENMEVPIKLLDKQRPVAIYTPLVISLPNIYFYMLNY